MKKDYLLFELRPNAYRTVFGQPFSTNRFGLRDRAVTAIVREGRDAAAEQVDQMDLVAGRERVGPEAPREAACPEAVQEGPHDAPHMRIVVDDEEAQLVEVDADHARPGKRTVPSPPRPTMLPAWLTNR